MTKFPMTNRHAFNCVRHSSLWFSHWSFPTAPPINLRPSAAELFFPSLEPDHIPHLRPFGNLLRRVGAGDDFRAGPLPPGIECRAAQMQIQSAHHGVFDALLAELLRRVVQFEMFPAPRTERQAPRDVVVIIRADEAN